MIAILAASLAPIPGRATVDQACTTSRTPERIWLGAALSQTFTPSGPDVAQIDVRILFRRTFVGRVDAILRLRAPTELATEDVGVAGPLLASLSTQVSGQVGRAHWLTFALAEPLPVPSGPAWALLEIEVRPGGGDPAWGWTECRHAYPGGRAYGRAPIPLDGAELPNQHLNVDLDDRDFQFRVHAS